MKPYDPELPTELLTDASRNYGIGYAIIQRETDGSPRLVDCHSRSLTPTESRYATIELELLAIVWAAKKLEFFLRGAPRFKVITDHRPLVGLFQKELFQIPNPRLLRLREKLAGLVFEVEWRPGKEHRIADALSRAPVFQPPENTNEDDAEEDNLSQNTQCRRLTNNPTMKSITDGTA